MMGSAEIGDQPPFVVVDNVVGKILAEGQGVQDAVTPRSAFGGPASYPTQVAVKERGDRLLSHPYGSGSGSWSPDHKTLPGLSPALWIWGYRGEIVFVVVGSLEQDNAPVGGTFSSLLRCYGSQALGILWSW